MPGVSGQQDSAACPGSPLQPQTLSCQPQFEATQVMQGNSQGQL